MDTSETTAPALADLVHRAQKGEEAAQHALILSYQRRVAGFIYAVVGRNDSIEDLTQTVFIKMIRGLERLHATAQFEAWLFRLARNVCIDYLRRQRLRHIFTSFTAVHEDIPEPPGTVGTEELDALRYALSRLRPGDRALLALAQEGRSQTEMAKITGVSAVVVKARLHRARERLREFYHPRHET
ncbi:MAG TPA: sigma-70 family RNA polymerase sigma factor [Opitutaceae bacterium]|nr:sigma-70 family RNA polymerase sigma factor [Opitutaceae bacterium]